MTKPTLSRSVFSGSVLSAPLCALALLLASPAMAQQPPRPAAATNEPLQMPKLSPEHVDLAIDVLKLSGMARSIDLIVPQMLDSARRMFTMMRPELAGEVEKTMKALEPEWTLQNKLATRIAAEAFAERLTEAELKDMKTFFSSESGKKFVAVQPSLLPDMMKNLDIFTGKLSTVVVEKIREDLKKRNLPF